MYKEKTIIQKDTCTLIFIAALFTIGKTQKQPKCSSTDEWIQKLCYTYTMKYCMCACSVTRHVQFLLTLRHSFSGKSTGVGCHFLLQGIFPTQESNTHLLHWQADFFTTESPLSMELFSHKKNEIMPSAATCVDSEIVILSEVSQTQKDKYTILLTCGIFKKRYKWIYLQSKNRVTDTENKFMVTKRGREGGGTN